MLRRISKEEAQVLDAMGAQLYFSDGYAPPTWRSKTTNDLKRFWWNKYGHDLYIKEDDEEE